MQTDTYYTNQMMEEPNDELIENTYEEPNYEDEISYSMGEFGEDMGEDDNMPLPVGGDDYVGGDEPAIVPEDNVDDMPPPLDEDDMHPGYESGDTTQEVVEHEAAGDENVDNPPNEWGDMDNELGGEPSAQEPVSSDFEYQDENGNTVTETFTDNGDGSGSFTASDGSSGNWDENGGTMTNTDGSSGSWTHDPETGTGSDTYTDPEGNVSVHTYDSDGNGTDTFTDGDGNVTTSSYNSDGSGSSTFPDGTTETWDNQGNVTVVDSDGNEITHDDMYVGETQNPDGTVDQYNEDGSATHTDGDGTQYDYNTDGTSEVHNPDASTEVYTEDGYAYVDESGNGYGYDDQGDGTFTSSFTTPDGEVVTTTETLDADGNGGSFTASDGSTGSWSVDPETGANTGTFTDAEGNTGTHTDDGQGNGVDTWVDADGNTTTITFSADGSGSIVHPDGSTEAFDSKAEYKDNEGDEATS